MMNQVKKRGKAKVAVAGDYIKAGVRSDRLPFDSVLSATTSITLYHHVPSLYKILLSTNNTTAKH